MATPEECLKIINSGVDINTLNGDMRTPLILAGISELCSTLPKTLNVENDQGDFPINIAARGGHTECIIALVNSGLDINQESKSMSGAPLHIAAEYGHLETCRKLLEMGAEINMSDCEYHTPLLYAANSGRKEICEFLIENGAWPKGNPEGGNPVEMARIKGHDEIVNLIERYYE